jgi:hypothetical protein
MKLKKNLKFNPMKPTELEEILKRHLEITEAENGTNVFFAYKKAMEEFSRLQKIEMLQEIINELQSLKKESNPSSLVNTHFAIDKGVSILNNRISELNK